MRWKFQCPFEKNLMVLKASEKKNSTFSGQPSLLSVTECVTENNRSLHQISSRLKMEYMNCYAKNNELTIKMLLLFRSLHP